jgi:predicted acetylornithine/succinylornithine family transaminase
VSSTAAIRDLYGRYVLGTYAPDLALARGEGAWVWDAGGTKYLDFGAGIAVCVLGHCHPEVVRAVREQAGRLMHVSNLYYNEPQALLARQLSGMAFDGKCFFANSGAEANEGLVKFARYWGREQGRFEIVCMRKSFHGRTLAMISATGQEKVRKGFDPLPQGFRHVDFLDLDAIRSAITETTAAVLVEPIQGEGGVRVPPDGALASLRRLCDEAGVLLLLDEIQTGMGRTGHFFAHQADGIVPDAMSVAKGLGNGFPIGAFVVRPELADLLPVSSHASTFGGNPLACAAGLAAARAVSAPGFLDHVRKMSGLLLEGLRTGLSSCPVVRDVRGRGLMIGIEVGCPAASVVKEAAGEGLLVVPAGADVIRLLPPLIVGEAEVEQALGTLVRVLQRRKEEVAA